MPDGRVGLRMAPRPEPELGACFRGLQPAVAAAEEQGHAVSGGQVAAAGREPGVNAGPVAQPEPGRKAAKSEAAKSGAAWTGASPDHGCPR